MWRKIAIDNTECEKDEWGFHVENGRRLTKRCGIDAYALQCIKCGMIGYPKRDWSQFIESGVTDMYTRSQEDRVAIAEALQRAQP